MERLDGLDIGQGFGAEVHFGWKLRRARSIYDGDSLLRNTMMLKLVSLDESKDKAS